MPAAQLRREGWAKLTRKCPDQQVISAILGICKYCARIGYEEDRSGITIHPNLNIAKHDINLVTTEIILELCKSSLEVYPDHTRQSSHFTAAPLHQPKKNLGWVKEPCARAHGIRLQRPGHLVCPDAGCIATGRQDPSGAHSSHPITPGSLVHPISAPIHHTTSDILYIPLPLSFL